MTHVIVVIGPGQIGQAIARRVGVGKHVVLADLRPENANAAAEVMSNAGYDVSVASVDVSSREAVRRLVETVTSIGDVTGLIHAAGVSPSQAPPSTILYVDLYGTALVLQLFGDVIAHGGSGVVIASQSGHRLPPLTIEQNKALATAPVEELLSLSFLQLDQVRDSLHAYHRTAWGGVPAHDRAVLGRTRRYTRRSRYRGRAPDGAGRWVHHWKRLSNGWWRDGSLLVRRARAAVSARHPRLHFTPHIPQAWGWHKSSQPSTRRRRPAQKQAGGTRRL